MNNNIPKNDVFCMFPWLHVYVESDGETRPCCIGTYGLSYGSVKTQSMTQILNSQVAKKLRLNMINGEKSSICNNCYEAEKVSVHSLRAFANSRFSHHYDDVMANTNLIDGTLSNIKLRYIDIRFSNICNFKCRSCGPLFSSLLSAEAKKKDSTIKIVQKPREDTKLLEEVLEHSEYIDQIYFAGGEPLITDEHYVILESLVKKNQTNILLRYNSNCSVISYKDKDLLDLWRHFKQIEFCASLDHYGEKAEYIRHGTDWGVVENNVLKINKLPNVVFSVNTVMSIFNYLTLYEFYQYLIEKKIIYRNDLHISLYRSLDPKFLCAQNLPLHLKEIGKEKNTRLINYLDNNGHMFSYAVKDAIDFVELTESYNGWKNEFQRNIIEKDSIRNENFLKTFPELESLLK
jgi:MoaA/NifB/PqqE/SkfB family radical SAM enzyme